MARKPAKKTPPKTAKKSAKKKTAKKAAATKAKPKSAAKNSSAAPKKTSAKKASAKKAPAKKASQKKSSARKADSPLSAKELTHFRKLLLEKRRSLIGDMAGMEGTALGRNQQESSGDLSNMPTHPADIGSDNYEYEFTLGLLESERIMLGEINEALERIANKTYGICLGTGEPIGRARLEARPWCKYSIEYQRQIEKGMVRPGEDDRYNPDGTLDEDQDDDED